MSYNRVPTKSARLIALHAEIQFGTFDPQTVNMSALAAALEVNRSTILRDLAVLDQVYAQIADMRAAIRAGGDKESYRLKN